MDEEGDLETPDFLPERLELFGRPRLSFEGRQLAPDLMNNVADSQQILVGGLQLSQRLGLLSLVADDPGCLFDQLAPLDRRCLQHTINPALLDDRMSFTASARVEQQAANVFQAAGRLIDEVLAHAVAEQSARHHDFVTFPERKWQSRRLAAAVAVVVWSSINIAEDEGDFGHAQRLTGLGPVEDDVLHPFAAQGLGALLAQDPEDRIEDVALANPVRPDDGRDPGLEAHLSLHEGLKPSHLQPHQIHRLPALPRGAVRRIRPWRKASTISCREMQIKTQPDGAAMSRYRTSCPVASVLGTTNRDGQAGLDHYLAEPDMAPDLFLQEARWKENWGGSYNDYAPLIDFARSHHLPVLALNPPKPLVRRVAKEGLSSALKDPGMLRWQMRDEVLSDEPAYREIIVSQLRACHSGLSEEAYQRMYEAAVFRDEGMAKTISDYLSRRAPGVGPVVSYTGGGHIQYRLPVPNRVLRRQNGPARQRTLS